MPQADARSLRAALLVTTSSIVLGSVPIIAVGQWETDSRTLAEKLREGPGVSNHPVHVRPSDAVRIPEGWPLDADGTITCRTCHERLPALNSDGQPHLRGRQDADTDITAFCANCHAGSDGRSAASMHWQALRFAHVPPASADAALATGTLDSDSRRCMMCHDGVNAAEAPSGAPGNRTARGIGDPARDHPVGIPYPAGSPLGRESLFRPAGLLPRAIRLPGGQVSCVSCHNLYSTTPDRLTVPIEGSKLCFSCHQL